MSYHCYKCNQIEVAEEFERCPSCEAAHKTLCAELDARPKVVVKRAREELFPFVEMKQGIKVTTYISREDAMIMGLKLPQ